MSVVYTAELPRPRSAYARRFPAPRAFGTSAAVSVKHRAGVVKRSVKIGTRRTSISIEDTFWAGLRDIARMRRIPIHRLLAEIADGAAGANLSSAIRVTVFEFFYQRAAI